MSQKPEKFGKYILLEKLAAGGMAEIFLAKAIGASGISKFVAVKRILPQFSDNEDFVRMFKDEAKIVINLSHPNIVSVYEFGVEKNQFHIVMDYVGGKNLRQILNKLKKIDLALPVEQVVYIIKEVASGLDHAHKCRDSSTDNPLNIIHRDISPQNIMISYEGDIRIVDFGIAKAESQVETTRVGTLKGKFGYMSPEQAEGKVIDLRTDVFSLGTILWELLANDRLFIANNEINTLRKVTDCKIPSLKKYNPNIHPELERIVQKSLSRDRNHRYQTSGELHKDLNRFLNRHYPDFISQDFSKILKEAFADQILSIRKKLVEYSNLEDIEPEIDDDKTYVSTSNISIQPNTQNQTNNKVNLPLEDATTVEPKTEANQPIKSSQTGFVEENINIDLSAPNTGFELDLAKINKTFDQKNLGGNSSGKHREKDYETKDFEQTKSGVTHHNKRNTHLNNRSTSNPNIAHKNSSDSNSVRSFLNLVLIFCVGSLGGITYFQDQICTTSYGQYMVYLPWIEIQCLSSIESPVKGTITTRPSQKLLVKPIGIPLTIPKKNKMALKYITVQSEPSGAYIYVDSKNTGFVTPSKIAVPEYKTFSLQLKKDGFIDYTKTNILLSESNERKVYATMIEAKIAYINIDVRPPTNARVSLNGQRLNESLPIRGYSIPAGQTVVIEAYNPVTKRKEKQNHRLKNKEQRTIIFNL